MGHAIHLGSAMVRRSKTEFVSPLDGFASFRLGAVGKVSSLWIWTRRQKCGGDGDPWGRLRYGQVLSQNNMISDMISGGRCKAHTPTQYQVTVEEESVDGHLGLIPAHHDWT